jgi:hypothetical protein
VPFVSSLRAKKRRAALANRAPRLPLYRTKFVYHVFGEKPAGTLIFTVPPESSMK